MHVVILTSEVYGREEFTYHTFEEAMAAVRHFAEESLRHCKADGIEREIAYYATPDSKDAPPELEILPKLRA